MDQESGFKKFKNTFSLQNSNRKKLVYVFVVTKGLKKLSGVNNFFFSVSFTNCNFVSRKEIKLCYFTLSK